MKPRSATGFSTGAASRWWCAGSLYTIFRWLDGLLLLGHDCDLEKVQRVENLLLRGLMVELLRLVRYDEPGAAGGGVPRVRVASGSAWRSREASIWWARGVDSVAQRWQPELPHSVWLYQAFCRDTGRDVRAHKLFIGINGGLNKCRDEFYNLLLDVSKEFTCAEVAFSI